MSTIHGLVQRAARRLFTHWHAAPIWLGVRLYLGYVWLRFGWAKIEGGWLVESPMPALLRAIADGHTATPIPAYGRVAELLIGLGLDSVMGAVIPLAEVGLGVAFVLGVALVPAAIAASLLNLNLILSGLASWSFDGRIIVLQLLLLAAWRVGGVLGVGALIARARRRAPRPSRAERRPARPRADGQPA